jgi:peptidoglycan/LPS O-acetylase OafA/YrhL
MAFHEGIRAVPGGFLGVDVFFVLSGYLITDLLTAHLDAHGRLDLRGFWIRRARRLLPALAVMLVTVTAAVAVIDPGQLPGLRPALVAAATYSSNWYQAIHHVPYFASFGPPPPLQHLWSLAIEEQFYLVWPLILGLVLTRVRSRRDRACVAWLGAVASALIMAFLYAPGEDPSRVYYGTDTHATALLIGAALALTWPLARLANATQNVTTRLDFLGIAGLGVLAWAIGHFSGPDPALYPAGLVIAAVAAAGLTAAAATPGTVSALLGQPALRWLGIRSYGIYLWHWPVITLTTALAGPGPTVPWLWLAESGAAIMLAAASWRWIETPILRNGFAATCRTACRTLAESVYAARKSPMRALPAVTASAAITVACTAGYGVIHSPVASGLEQQVAHGEQISAASSAAIAADRGSRSAPMAHRPGSCPGRAAGAVTTRKVPGSQITAIGDSVMLASAPQLAAALPGISIDAQVSRQMTAGLTVVRSLAARGRLRPVVLVGLGTNGTVTGGQIGELLREIGSSRTLVLVNTFVDRPWEHAVDSALAAAARTYPNVVLANWAAAIEHRTYLLWGDGVHPRPPGARLYARVVTAAVQSACAAATTPPWTARLQAPSTARTGTGG